MSRLMVASFVQQLGKAKPKRIPRPKVSALEAQFDRAWSLLRPSGMSMPLAEYRFHPIRRWRFDRCWLAPDGSGGVAVEFQGGIYVHGRHSRAAGYNLDCDKLNTAQLCGWMVLKFTRDHLKDAQGVVDTVVKALRKRGVE